MQRKGGADSPAAKRGTGPKFPTQAGSSGLFKDVHPLVLVFSVLGCLIASYTLYVTMVDDGSSHHHHGHHGPTIPGGGPLSIPGLAQYRRDVNKAHAEEGELLKRAEFGGQNGRATHLYFLGAFNAFNYLHSLVMRESDLGRSVGLMHTDEEDGSPARKLKDMLEAEDRKKDPLFTPPHANRKWFPSVFSSVSATEVEQGEYSTCWIPPDRKKSMDRFQKRHQRETRTLSRGLYNPEMALKLEGAEDDAADDGHNDGADQPNKVDANAKKALSASEKKKERQEAVDIGGAHRITYRHSLNEAVDLKFMMERYYTLRGFNTDKDKEAGLEELRSKRAPNNPWVEARSMIAKYGFDVASQWKKEGKRHYGQSLMETANSMCTNLLDVKQAQKENQWFRNRKLVAVTANVEQLDQIERTPEENSGEGGKKMNAEQIQKSITEKKRKLLGAALDQELPKDVADSLLHLKSVHNEAMVGGVGMQRAASAPTPGSTLAEQSALLSKVQVWDPLCVSQRLTEHANPGIQEQAQNAIQTVIMNRPTILCTVTTMFRKLRLAVLQHQLWGSQCDEFLIFVADGHRHWDRKAKEAFEKELEGFETPLDSTNIVYLKASFGQDSDGEEEKDVNLLGPQDDLMQWEEASLSERKNQWQTHREIVNFLSTWHMTTSFEYFFFGNEDTYLVPENLYEMLTLNPEYKMLHEMGSALLLGNRMVVPSTKQAFVSSASGYVMNYMALSMRTMLLAHEDCEPMGVSNNDDVLLAKCMSVLGVVPRDTSDEYGQDRFTALNLEWMIRTAVDSTASWWYHSYRKRGLVGDNAGLEDMDQHGGNGPWNGWSGAVFGGKYDPSSNAALAGPSISASAVTFAYVSSPSRAVWLHEQLFGLPPAK